MKKNKPNIMLTIPFAEFSASEKKKKNFEYEVTNFSFRIYPTDEQAHIMSQSIDVIDALYNAYVHQYKAEFNDILIKRMTELGIEDKIIKNDEGEIVLATNTHSEAVCVQLAIINNVTIPYKEISIKDKKTGKYSNKTVVDMKALKAALKKKDIFLYDYPDTSKYSYLTYTNANEEAKRHFSLVGGKARSSALRHFNTALKNFIEGRTKFPTYKRRSKARDEFGEIYDDRIHGSYEFGLQNMSHFHLYDTNKKGTAYNEKFLYCYVAKVNDFVKVRVHRAFPENCFISHDAIISKTADGQYYIRFKVYQLKSQNVKDIKKSIGFDLSMGSDSILVGSNGEKISTVCMDKDIERLENHMKALQKKLDNKKDATTKNFAKLNKKIRVIEQRILRKKKYNQEQLATKLVNDYDTILLEDIDLAELKRKPKMVKEDKKISEKDRCALTRYYESDLKNPMFLKKLEYKGKIRDKIQNEKYGEFISTLEWFAHKAGKTVQKIDRYYPSTQTCSCCGHINTKYKGFDGLIYRTFTCEECGYEADRDVNAANNIKKEGLRYIEEGIVYPVPKKKSKTKKETEVENDFELEIC